MVRPLRAALQNLSFSTGEGGKIQNCGNISCMCDIFWHVKAKGEMETWLRTKSTGKNSPEYISSEGETCIVWILLFLCLTKIIFF